MIEENIQLGGGYIVGHHTSWYDVFERAKERGSRSMLVGTGSNPSMHSNPRIRESWEMALGALL